MPISTNRNGPRNAVRGRHKESVKGLLKFQLAAMIATPLLFMLESKEAVLSTLIGGGIALTATGLQVVGFFRPYRAQNPRAILGAMVASEILKLVVIGLLFAMVFKGLRWIDPFPILTGFIVVYLTPNVLAFLGRQQAS